ncbi:molecular chaperone DnaJ [Kouleothrix sp.]|uniref:molecular chaperone DnaJ n=1 Tax=Kouleothrix sp. TaxID=2779161 RepID=UPI00391B7709
MLSFDELLELLGRAATPSEVFGALAAPEAAALRQRYRALMLLAHPDHNPARAAEANAACRALHEWYAAAQRQLATGAYGAAPRICIASGARQYAGYAVPLAGELCELFPAEGGGERVLLKTARSARDNDLLQAEARALREIERGLAGQRVRAHFPTLIEHLLVSDAAGARRQMNVLRAEQGVVSLAEVIRAYPAGLDPADAAWMFNRVLAALGSAHSLGLLHGAVTPAHVLVRPADHNGILVGWCASVPIGEPLRLRSPAYAADYPPEVAARQPATPATDIYLAAACMARLLGGDPFGPALPPRVPRPIARLLRACLIAAPQRRIADAWQLFDEFRALLGQLYGPPQFRPFAMPAGYR